MLFFCICLEKLYLYIYVLTDNNPQLPSTEYCFKVYEDKFVKDIKNVNSLVLIK